MVEEHHLFDWTMLLKKQRQCTAYCFVADE